MIQCIVIVDDPRIFVTLLLQSVMAANKPAHHCLFIQTTNRIAEHLNVLSFVDWLHVGCFFQVVHFAESGYRLPPPCYCPRVLHAMMLDCWHRDRSYRPSFKHLVTQLDRFLLDMNCLNDTLNNRYVVRKVWNTCSLIVVIVRKRSLKFPAVSSLIRAVICCDRVIPTSANNILRNMQTKPLVKQQFHGHRHVYVIFFICCIFCTFFPYCVTRAVTYT